MMHCQVILGVVEVCSPLITDMLRLILNRHCLEFPIEFLINNTMPESETPTIETEVQVMFFDTDCAAVVHNISYLRFIEIARTLLGEQLGMGLAAMAANGRYPVVVRTEVDYRRPAKLGDKLLVKGWLDKVERMRFWCAFDITRPSDGTLIVQARQTMALVQMPEGRPVRLPADWDVRFAHLRP